MIKQKAAWEYVWMNPQRKAPKNIKRKSQVIRNPSLNLIHCALYKVNTWDTSGNSAATT